MIRPSWTSTPAGLTPSGVTTRRDRKALRLIVSADTVYTGSAQQQGTATASNTQGALDSPGFPRKISNGTQCKSVIIPVIEDTPAAAGGIQGPLWR